MSTMLGEISAKELHGPWFDFMDKLQGNESALWFAAFKRFLRKENPWDGATKKERITFTVTGLGLTGTEWITRLEYNGHELSSWANNIITKPDYDQNHRLEAGKEYKVTLVFGKEIKKDKDRSTANLKAIAIRELGEQAVTDLKGELALLIRERFSNLELEAMGVGYIAVLHEPIIDSGGGVDVLNSGRNGNKSLVNADDGGRPSRLWNYIGAFAFFET
jgi:hypothetical protein